MQDQNATQRNKNNQLAERKKGGPRIKERGEDAPPPLLKRRKEKRGVRSRVWIIENGRERAWNERDSCYS